MTLLLTSCAVLMPGNQQCAVVTMPPLQNSAWPDSYRTLELVTLQRAPAADMTAPATQQLIMAVKRDAQMMQIKAINALGLEVFGLIHTDGPPSVQSMGDASPALDFSVVVADFQLVHWPVEVLGRALAGTPWNVSGDLGVRTLTCDGVQRVTVEYAANMAKSTAIKLSNRVAGYTLEILPLSSPRDLITAHE